MIGVFDSGLGGLSIVREVIRLQPDTAILYLGDRAWAPYGERALLDIRQRSELIAGHLLAEGAGAITIACNTASAAALHHLRAVHPEVPFVGMEPAVKPAAALTSSGVIAVLATPATLTGELYASVVDRFAADVRVIETPCPGWMEMVEDPTPDAVAESAIRASIEPVLAEGADVLVLGCTHYPFLRHHIERVAGSGVTIVDPGEAVARQVIRVAGPASSRGELRIQVTGGVEGVADRVRALTGFQTAVTAVTLPHRVR